MNKNTIDIRTLLIQNLASSAARKGGLSENEAKCWAKALADMILKSDDFEFDDIEQLITNPFAIDSFLVKSCEKLSDLEVTRIFPSVEKTHYLCAGKNEDSPRNRENSPRPESSPGLQKEA